MNQRRKSREEQRSQWTSDGVNFESGVAQENCEEVESDRHCSTKGGGSGEVSGSEGEGNTLYVRCKHRVVSR